MQVFLDLGRTPLANALRRPEDLSSTERTYPLQLARCTQCSLIQILETVPPEELFSEYLYFSSFSTTMVEHARILATKVIESERLNANSLVVEIASNDGYLLQWYVERGIPVLGVEPARNVAAVAVKNCIPTTVEFFKADVARHLVREGRHADVIHANNVLAHVTDLNDVMSGVATLLAPRGVAIFEVPYVKDLLDKVEFDTVYHEHLCYFSLTALDWLCRAHGLLIADVDHLAIHGGSLRIFVRHRSTVQPGPRVADLLTEEEAWVRDASLYEAFHHRVENLGQELKALLRRLRDEGKTICAYGAAAKGSTLLNSFGIDGSLIDFVVDRSDHKQGMYMPGVNLPIYAPNRLLSHRPDYVLLLTWNFAAEVLTQQAEFRRLGGKFIIPVPVPTVV